MRPIYWAGTLALVVSLPGCGGAPPPSGATATASRPAEQTASPPVRPDTTAAPAKTQGSTGPAAAPPTARNDNPQTIAPRMRMRAQGAENQPWPEVGSAPPDEPSGGDTLGSDEAGSAEMLPGAGEISADDEEEESDHLMVRLFYATDRKPYGQPQVTARMYVERFYPMALASGVTALLIFVTPRLLKRRLSVGLTLLGLASTAALGVAAAWSCWLIYTDYYALRSEYSSSRGELSVGVCDVSIPLSHETGEVETPSLLRFELRADPGKHIIMQEATPLRPVDFYAQLRDRVAGSPQKDAFVFVHGFDNTFEDAVRRTAQMAFDLRFEGAAICYTWPSQGGLLKYFVDESNVEWTVPHLKQFLSDLSARSGATRIHLIAHSMGNRALTNALRALSWKQTQPKFEELILTAPDIDAEVFKRDIAPAIAKTARRVTLYASQTDRALALSRKLHGSPRAGDTGSELIVLPQLDTVDVTAVDTSLIGHSYYDRSESVLADMHELLHSGRPPARRRWLHRMDQDGLPYWVFDPNAEAIIETAQPEQPARR